MNWLIHDYREDDLAAVVHLIDSTAGLGQESVFSLAECIGALTARQPAVVAVHDGLPIGAALAQVAGAGERAWVMRVAIAPAWRGRGLAGALLRELERRLVAGDHPVRTARYREDDLRPGHRLPPGLAVRRTAALPPRRRGQPRRRAARRVHPDRRAGAGAGLHRRGGGDRARAGRARPGGGHARGDQRTAQADPRVPGTGRPAAGLRHQLGPLARPGVPAHRPFRLRHSDRHPRPGHQGRDLGTLRARYRPGGRGRPRAGGRERALLARRDPKDTPSPPRRPSSATTPCRARPPRTTLPRSARAARR